MLSLFLFVIGDIIQKPHSGLSLVESSCVLQFMQQSMAFNTKAAISIDQVVEVKEPIATIKGKIKGLMEKYKAIVWDSNNNGATA